MSDAQLEILASRAGLAVDWIDANGRPQKVAPAVLRNVLTGLGHPANTAQEIDASLLQLRHQYIIPNLSGTQALGAHMLGRGAVSARWRLGDGSELRIDLNLSDTPVVNPPHTDAVWLFQQPGGVTPDSGELPAYCALVSLTAATPLLPLDGERL